MKIILLVTNCSIFVLALRQTKIYKRIPLSLGYAINCEYEGQLSHSIDRLYAVSKFQLPKLNEMPMIFKKYGKIAKCPSTIYM